MWRERTRERRVNIESNRIESSRVESSRRQRHAETGGEPEDAAARCCAVCENQTVSVLEVRWWRVARHLSHKPVSFRKFRRDWNAPFVSGRTATSDERKRKERKNNTRANVDCFTLSNLALHTGKTWAAGKHTRSAHAEREPASPHERTNERRKKTDDWRQKGGRNRNGVNRGTKKERVGI